jgi:excisionase family DNA binding protein
MLRHAEGRLLTVEEVAAELRVSPQTVYRRIGAGELEAVQLGRGSKAPIRIRVGAVERFLARGGPDREETNQ